jgi:hypothetical protein
MFGIKTKIRSDVVHTVWFHNKWTTIVSSSIELESLEAEFWVFAGENHLKQCQKLINIKNNG